MKKHCILTIVLTIALGALASCTQTGGTSGAPDRSEPDSQAVSSPESRPSSGAGEESAGPLVTGIPTVAYPAPEAVYAYDTLTEDQKIAYDAFAAITAAVLADHGRENRSYTLPRPVETKDMLMARTMYMNNFKSLQAITNSFIFDGKQDGGELVESLYFDRNDQIPESFASEMKRYTDTLQAADAVLGSLEHDGTDYSKAFAVARWITEHVDYNDALEEWRNPWISFADGPLLHGEAVCGGFANVFDLLCKRAGLLSFSVTGDTCMGLHVWNMICLNGNWYYVDTTWMKSDFYSNFMMPDKIFLANGHFPSEYYRDDFYPERTIPCPPADSTDLYQYYYASCEQAIAFFEQTELEEKSYPVVLFAPEELQKLLSLQGRSITDAANRTYRAGVIQLDEISCQVSFSAADDSCAVACF